MSENAQLSQGDDENIRALLANKLEEIELNQNEEKRIQKLTAKHLQDLKNQVENVQGGTEEKFKFLYKKYTQVFTETQKFDKLQKKIEQLKSENVHLDKELQIANGVKSRLESIARELQKRNTDLIQENKSISVEEENKRDQLSGKFNNSMKEIASKLDEYNDQREKHSQHIELLQNKLKTYAEQYELRDKQFNNVLRAKDLEKQVLESKLKQTVELLAQETIRCKAYQEQVEKSFKEEFSLRSTVTFYEEKFKQFQEAITKSNEVFANFKNEMEKMSKINRILEKENQSLKTKTNQTDRVLLEMADERNANRKSIDTLKNLCRSLTTERSELKLQLKQFIPSDELERPNTISNSNIATQIENIEKSTTTRDNNQQQKLNVSEGESDSNINNSNNTKLEEIEDDDQDETKQKPIQYNSEPKTESCSTSSSLSDVD
ncbi:hypothetical protein DLAC_08716 [Tieghemostelium lacteum]|uniref:Alpha-taxilin n=1 Tax=Tieghemostelium lacteum TaxID=361077 RepID=A0A151Z868_TIELA|nr:hypothetical protein DLAC_08716 [Tieghemostelium lacteum]|eukprot:KYQ90128.1 hypothetical protein DLAC_08716 [Tieghemostelium lacteum]